MENCPNCKKPILEEYKICPFCGEALAPNWIGGFEIGAGT